MAVAMALGLVLNYLGLNAVKMLFWSAVINGLLGPCSRQSFLRPYVPSAKAKILQLYPGKRLDLTPLMPFQAFSATDVKTAMYFFVVTPPHKRIQSICLLPHIA